MKNITLKTFILLISVITSLNAYSEICPSYKNLELNNGRCYDFEKEIEQLKNDEAILTMLLEEEKVDMSQFIIQCDNTDCILQPYFKRLKLLTNKVLNNNGLETCSTNTNIFYTAVMRQHINSKRLKYAIENGGFLRDISIYEIKSEGSDSYVDINNDGTPDKMFNFRLADTNGREIHLSGKTSLITNYDGCLRDFGFGGTIKMNRVSLNSFPASDYENKKDLTSQMMVELLKNGRFETRKLNLTNFTYYSGCAGACQETTIFAILKDELKFVKVYESEISLGNKLWEKFYYPNIEVR